MVKTISRFHTLIGCKRQTVLFIYSNLFEDNTLDHNSQDVVSDDDFSNNIYI